MKRAAALLTAFVLSLTAWVGLTATSSAQTASAATSPGYISYVVSAHPDDYLAAWSLIDQSYSNYKVFINLTEGEETGACTSPIYAGTYQPELHEQRPIDGDAGGRWTYACEQNRIHSELNFLNYTENGDSSIPDNSGSGYTVTTTGNPQHRHDCTQPNEFTCPGFVDNSATVYPSTNGYGEVIDFDLGDGDLTQVEATWAINYVLNHRAAFGIPTNLPDYNLISGSFRNGDPGYGCQWYDHPDHRSVHSTLYNHRFGHGLAYQAAPTCADDPDTYENKRVPDDQWTNLTAYNHSNFIRYGGYGKWYGWLWDYPSDNNPPHSRRTHTFGCTPSQLGTVAGQDPQDSGYKHPVGQGGRHGGFFQCQSFWLRFLT